MNSTRSGQPRARCRASPFFTHQFELADRSPLAEAKLLIVWLPAVATGAPYRQRRGPATSTGRS
jgi:hypothetical protein